MQKFKSTAIMLVSMEGGSCVYRQHSISVKKQLQPYHYPHISSIFFIFLKGWWWYIDVLEEWEEYVKQVDCDQSLTPSHIQLVKNILQG